MRTQWQGAVDQYIAWHYKMNVEYLPKFGTKLCKSLIEHVATIDPRWSKFPLESFNTSRYPVHNALYHALRNKYQAI